MNTTPEFSIAPDSTEDNRPVHSAVECRHYSLPTGSEHDEDTQSRLQWISVAAYHKAEARGFEPGNEIADWLEAEKDYAEMQIARYLSVFEEDGGMTKIGLRRLAKAVGVEDPERYILKADLVRAIQSASRNTPCFQQDPAQPCDKKYSCLWQTECLKLIAVWYRY